MGENVIDLLELYAPWALETCSTPCAVEGVACVVRPGAAWTALRDLLPVGDQKDEKGNPINGLHNVNHWVAAVTAGGSATEAADPLNLFYQERDRFVIGTVCDGDCGMDVMTQMLEWPQNFESRTRMRTELYDYLIARHREPWLHDMLVLAGEVTAEELQAHRALEKDDDDGWFADPGGGKPGVGEAGGAAAIASRLPEERSKGRTFVSGPYYLEMRARSTKELVCKHHIDNASTC